jgi:S-adenosylmethionine-dependent methyltransferase
MLEATQFRDAEKYSKYLSTLSGRLRTDLAWRNLQSFLPDPPAKRRVLDLGGGTGAMSLRLAQKGFEVVLLDSVEEMLEIARTDADALGFSSRIFFRHGDAGQLRGIFEPESFDFVVCHNVLEFVPDHRAALRGIAHVMRKDGDCSLLVRNRAGEVLKAAIKSPDLRVAHENLSADSAMDSLYGKPVRMFDQADVIQMLVDADLCVVAEYGVRVFSDYREAVVEPDAETYRQLLELEFTLGTRPQFAAIARYIQTIARHSGEAQNTER